MTTAWFKPDVALWFSFLSLFSLLAVLGPFAERGERRKLVLGAFTSAMGTMGRMKALVVNRIPVM
jgi:hypothetical protein